MKTFTALTPGRLLPGDYVIDGLGKVVCVTVERVTTSATPGYYSVTFDNGATVQVHKSTFVHIKRTTP